MQDFTPNTFWFYFSESFPTDIRTASVGIVHTLETVALMVNVKCYPLLTASIGFSSVAYIYRDTNKFQYISLIILMSAAYD